MYDKIIVVGIFVSLIYYEITGFSANGLIVPGYIAINLNNPERILSTLLVSLATFLIVDFLSRFLIIYGKRQFTLSVGIAVLINLFLAAVLPTSPGVIGHIVPGIIANEWKKEGIVISLISLSVVVCIIVLIMLAFQIPVI